MYEKPTTTYAGNSGLDELVKGVSNPSESTLVKKLKELTAAGGIALMVLSPMNLPSKLYAEETKPKDYQDQVAAIVPGTELKEGIPLGLPPYNPIIPEVKKEKKPNWVKRHPYWTAFGGTLGGILLYSALSDKGSNDNGTPTTTTQPSGPTGPGGGGGE